jgi:periplasmic protein TonB
MEPKQILSASLLDLVFDDRNKQYGAYELRVTYPERIKKSLLFTFAIALLAFTGAVMANSFKPKETGVLAIKEVTLTDIKPDEKKPEPFPEEKKPEPKPEVQTEKLTEFKIVDKDMVEPPPTQEDLKESIIDVFKKEGVPDEGFSITEDLDKNKGIIEVKKEEEPEIYPIVQISAKYDGDWVKFLTRNLNAEVPIDNSAPAGRYNVIIQFVVDKEGNVSDIKAITNHGYGMEQEAMRVLKKAKGWKPGIQNGHEVNSYHKQPITFEVMDNE